MVYGIMRHEGALYVPPSGAFLVLVECVVELCVRPVLVNFLSLSCIWHWWYSDDHIHLSFKDGWTALMRASKAGQLECVKVLLDKGAEVNMQSWVSGVIIHCVNAMQHVPEVSSSE